jgi:hypothetical protein
LQIRELLRILRSLRHYAVFRVGVMGVSFRTMQTDKEIAIELIDALEEMHYREIIYEAVLGAIAPPDWRKYFDQAVKKGDHREEVRGWFLPMRERVLDAPDLTAAVREMLEGLERIDPEDSGIQ